jgi:hypothetical protein
MMYNFPPNKKEHGLTAEFELLLSQTVLTNYKLPGKLLSCGELILSGL